MIGAGNAGKTHLRLLKELLYYEIVGFYDPNETNAKTVIDTFNLQRFSSADELMEAVDVIDIATPTLHHFDLASKALKLSKHIFIEKPMTRSLKDAKTLRALAAEADVKVQVGHRDRFNPAFHASREHLKDPMFIDTQRLIRFDPDGSEISVVHDILLNDIDLVLSVVRSNIKRISASGVAITGETPDIVNARIEFDNGCVANLTASRIAIKTMIRFRSYQKDAYLFIDLLENDSKILRIKNAESSPDPLTIPLSPGREKGGRKVMFEDLQIEPADPVKMELEAFAEAILNNTDTPVTIDDSYRALDVAAQITEKISRTTDFLSENAISA